MYHSFMYKVQILIKAKDSSVLIDKSFKTPELEGLLIINGSDLYAEAQQVEIERGLDIDLDDEYVD